MKFLQRLMGGEAGEAGEAGEGGEAGGATPAAAAAGRAGPTSDDSDAAEPDLPLDGDEQARELSLLKEEHRRLDDLAQRQQRYAEYAWQPPRQGSDRRADDAAES